MSFDYDKFKAEEEKENFWTAYADLFQQLSIVFLLLYVVATISSGTHGISQGVEFERIQAENEDLKQQIKVYNTLNDDYLEKNASEDEKQMYEEMISKLDLLKEDASVEKDRLQLEALENEKKALALNKYQQMIRNIVNTNMMAQARIKKRDEKIVEVVKSGKKKVKDLERAKAIAIAEAQLEKENEVARMEEESQRKLSDLEERKKKIQSALSEKEQVLASTKSALSNVQTQLEEESQKKEKLVGELQNMRTKYKDQAESMEREFATREAKAKADFEARVASEKMSAALRAQELANFKSESEKQRREHDVKVAALNSRAQASEYKLKKAQEIIEARGKLAKQIQDNFKKHGIHAGVNPDTGDVELSFGEEYFDTGRAELKPGMEKILKELMPVYAQSLFQNQKISNKLGSVEIIGYASPTYKGKYVDPNSMNESDKKAVNFNLDLSYFRAKSIFNHVFDSQKVNFEHQDTLVKMVKVTGRSFLAEKTASDREVSSGMSEKEFCKVYNCKKAQRVVIKFNLQD